MLQAVKTGEKKRNVPAVAAASFIVKEYALFVCVWGWVELPT
jgi:hypothetical protein